MPSPARGIETSRRFDGLEVLIWDAAMAAPTWHDVEQFVREIEALQEHKVIDLARRLRPGLTLEDVRNPHDFPELGDPDWQYEDGLLAGIQTVLSAIRARRREAEEAP
jgi:hypothetical protein